jgi:hypothetical protein
VSLSVLVLHVALEQTLLVRILSGLLHRAELLLSVQDDLYRVGSRWAGQVACKWVVAVQVACNREVAGEFREQAYQEAGVRPLHYPVFQEQVHLALLVSQEQAHLALLVFQEQVHLALLVFQEQAHLELLVFQEQAQEQVIRISILT